MSVRLAQLSVVRRLPSDRHRGEGSGRAQAQGRRHPLAVKPAGVGPWPHPQVSCPHESMWGCGPGCSQRVMGTLPPPWLGSRGQIGLNKEEKAAELVFVGEQAFPR